MEYLMIASRLQHGITNLIDERRDDEILMKHKFRLCKNRVAVSVVILVN
jgi:hypothetical protein